MHFRELTDRYSLDKILRSTRTGTVLRATDSRSGQAVAVKLMNVPSPAELVQRAPQFEKLTTALEALRHPSLPVILDSGFTTEGSAFLVMELLDGRTLDTVAGSPTRLLALLFHALNGLEAMARRGLSHHNVSPDNLLLLAGAGAAEPSFEQAPEQVKILGLGTAVFRGAGAAPAETARFRAPELDSSAPGPAAGEPADWHADLYSFACTACQVVGATVGLGESPVVQLPFALSLELENSEALRQTLERALRRSPADRPSHQELRDAFRLALGVADIPAPVEEKPAAGPKLVIPPAVAAPPPPIKPIAQPTSPPMSTPAAPPAPAAPPPPLPAVPDLKPDLKDETGGELLSSIDDDLLNALGPLPSAPAAGAAAPAPPPFRQGAAPPSGAVVSPFRPPGTQGRSAAASVAPPRESPLRNPMVLLGAAVGLVLLLGIAYWWFSRSVTPEKPAVETAAAPVPPPRKTAAEVFAEAQLAFADGDDARSLEILRTLSAADQNSLPPESCRALQSLQQTLALSAIDRLPDNLGKGLKGDIGRLRSAVQAAAGQDAAVPEALRPDLDRARGLVDLYAQIEAAAGRKAHAEVLDRFSVLTQQLPNATDPSHLRDQAADAVEEEAEAMAREGRYPEAIEHLGPIQRSWSARPGFKARLDGYQRAQRDEAAQEKLLAELPNYEKRHRPDEGLDRLSGVSPTPHLAAEFAEIRRRLEEQLAQIDGQAPLVELRDGYLLDYDRGRVVELSFRVTDDYKVRKVKLMARPEGGKMRELPLEASRRGYTVELPPAFHQNGTVEFYVTATDVSGHTGSFGSPDRPQQLKRREGFQRILR